MGAEIFKTGSAIWLFGVLCTAVLTMWVPGAWINPSLFQTALFGLALCWAVRMAWRPYLLRGSWVLVFLGLAALWPLVQLAAGQTVSRWETWNAALAGVGNFAAAFLALQIFSGDLGVSDHGPRRRAAFLRMLGFFAFGILLLALFDSLTGDKRIFWFDATGWGSAYGPFRNRDRMATFGVLVLPLILFGRGQKKIGLLEVGMAAGVFAAVIAAASRAGAALAIGEAGVLLWIARQRPLSTGEKQSYAWGGILAFVGMAAIFTAVVGSGRLMERFEEKNPYRERKEMLLSAVTMAQERPWFGFGVGNWENAYPKYGRFDTAKIVNHAHNDWAEWLATGGIPLLLMMCGVAGWAAPRAYRSVWGFGVIAVFAHALVDFPLQNATIELWVFTLLGVLASADADGLNQGG